MAKLCTYSIYLSTSDLLSFIFSNTDKQKISSTCIWKWISCCNDIMNHIDCVIKSEVSLQKMHSGSKSTLGIDISFFFFFFEKYPWYVKKKYIIGVIAWVFRQLKDELNYMYMGIIM